MVVGHDGVLGDPGGEESWLRSTLAEERSCRLFPRSEATRIRKSWLKMLSSCRELPRPPTDAALEGPPCGGGLSSPSPSSSRELHLASEFVSLVSIKKKNTISNMFKYLFYGILLSLNGSKEFAV